MNGKGIIGKTMMVMLHNVGDCLIELASWESLHASIVPLVL